MIWEVLRSLGHALFGGRTCPRCGGMNRWGAAYCNYCRAPLRLSVLEGMLYVASSPWRRWLLWRAFRLGCAREVWEDVISPPTDQ